MHRTAMNLVIVGVALALSVVCGDTRDNSVVEPLP
jgi:hypothetical protein